MKVVNVDLFERQWQDYRSLVDNDLLEHAGVTAAAAEALHEWVAAHPQRSGHGPV